MEIRRTVSRRVGAAFKSTKRLFTGTSAGDERQHQSTPLQLQTQTPEPEDLHPLITPIHHNIICPQPMRQRSSSYRRTSTHLASSADTDSFHSFDDSIQLSNAEQEQEQILLPPGPNDQPTLSADHALESPLGSLPPDLCHNTTLSSNTIPTIQTPPLTQQSQFGPAMTMSTAPQPQQPQQQTQHQSSASMLPIVVSRSGSVDEVGLQMDPVFVQANQIDHLDKSLDVQQNDLLAEQMAINILEKIDAGVVDELDKLKEEIGL